VTALPAGREQRTGDQGDREERAAIDVLNRKRGSFRLVACSPLPVRRLRGPVWIFRFRGYFEEA
jgi:hypothetical protein